MDGLIVDNCGEHDSESPQPAKCTNNNLILNKLKIALALIAEYVIDIMYSPVIRRIKCILAELAKNKTYITPDAKTNK